MRGRVQPEGQSCRNLRTTSSQHMRSAFSLAKSTNNTVAVQGDHHSARSSSITTTSSNSFFKDGRKINIGDCALFKPPQDFPPFIGLIRSLAGSKDNTLQLGVNWLYRPAEIKLCKGSPVEGAPNEIFYSFHKDEIPAASLLHPCKVAFLPRGVGLPAGTSSFVCRRVYDIASKCLWWLTDQDYVNILQERQEEVDQLLHKTRTEMHATLQSGGRSPKQINGPTSTSQLKPASDNQNTGTLHSHAKGKKRERGDHSAEPLKRERNLRSDDSSSFQCKTDSNLKSEIARITERGGLTELEGVERLVQLMQPDSMEKKMDLVGRSMIAGVMAATDKVDCLNRFVQLRGLPVLDEWLQDVHKGRDGNSLKDSDKAVEEFILVSLRALDRLPVNLQALQMCNIGKSVNHLRSHKNVEIQRKARSLVDMWKKRVEAEMISIDSKSASTQGASVWSSRSRLPDASQSGSRTPSGSDGGMKSSVQNSVSKATSARSSHGESNIKSVTASPGHVKTSSPPSSGKDSQPRISGGAPDIPLIREDRNSSSNQSHNHTESSGKEDEKSSVALPASVNKISGVSTRNRKNSGFSGTSVTGSQKETTSSRSSPAPKGIASEKLAQSSLSCEKVLEGPGMEGSNHKLIVKIPNRSCSPAHVAVGRSIEDSTCISGRVSSLVVSDKHEQFDCTSDDKTADAYQSNVGSDMNADSWQNGDAKDALTGSADGTASPAALPDEEQSMSTEDSRKSFDTPPTNQLKSGKMHDPAFSSMNALIESCVKYSEATTSLPIEDDVGMKLLASVATGEMSRTGLVSPSDSTEQSTPAIHEVCLGDEAKSISSPENNVMEVQFQSNSNDGETGDKKPVDSRSEDVSPLSKGPPLDVSGDKISSPVVLTGDASIQSGTDVRDKVEPKSEISENSNEKTSATSLILPIPAEKVGDGESKEEIQEGKGTSGRTCTRDIGNCKSGGVDVILMEEKASDPLPAADEGKLIVGDVAPEQSPQSKHETDTKERFGTGGSQQNLTSAIIKLESASSEKLMQTACAQNSVLEASNSAKVPSESFDMEVERNAAGGIYDTSRPCSMAANKLKKLHDEAILGNKEILEHISATERVYPGSMEHEVLKKKEPTGMRYATNQTDELNESASSVAMASDTDAKIKFDLNEGFSADEGKYGEPAKIISSDATTVHMIKSLSFYVNSVPSSQISNITVAAAAKGPFVPPEDLLRSKGELGWKGSAATSAFRPAEPRKVLEMPLDSTNISSADTSASKHSRVLLDIDLNVPDERALEEMASRDSVNEAPDSLSARGSGGLDLDLNRVDEASDNGNCSTSGNYKGESSTMHVKPFGGLPPGDARIDFDLNDGPMVDDCVEAFSINQQVKSGMPPQLSPLGLRMNGPGQESLTSWFTPGNSFSTIAISSVLPDRGENSFQAFPPSAPQRTLSPSRVSTFPPDVYRGSVLSSSAAVPFPSSPFQLPVLPYRTTLPVPSATFPVGGASLYMDSSSGPRLFASPVHSQFLGPVGSVAPQFQRPPYMVNLQDSSSNNGKRGKQGGLDLNAGPAAAAMESEAREMLPLSSNQRQQAFAEEQARIYTSVMKRKEPPESGWENDSFRFKQSSWP